MSFKGEKRALGVLQLQFLTMTDRNILAISVDLLNV